jgi:hypothetical protein
MPDSVAEGQKFVLHSMPLIILAEFHTSASSDPLEAALLMPVVSPPRFLFLGTRQSSLLRHFVVSRKVTGSIPYEMIRFFKERTARIHQMQTQGDLHFLFALDSEDGGDMFLRNLRLSPNYVALQPRSPNSS